MKTFSNFVLECSRLDESSLSRIKSKHDKGGVAVLSASRGDKSSKENRERAKSLDRDVRSKFGAEKSESLVNDFLFCYK